MSILPANKRKVAEETPKVFVVYGESMHGKTYFADEFPNPIIFNTDDNARSIETPSQEIYNGMVIQGEELSVWEYMTLAINELADTKNSFETVVIDTTEDVFHLLQEAIANERDKEYIGDIPHGVGWGHYKNQYRTFVMSLKKLTLKKNMNVVYILRAKTFTVNGTETKVPDIGDKELNVINGNSDYRILCQKVGKNYIRRTTLKRKNYTREKIGDKNILKILDTVVGAFDKSKKTSTKEAKQIVDEQEKQEEAERIAKQKEREATKKEQADKAEQEQRIPEQQLKTEPHPIDKIAKDIPENENAPKPRPRRRPARLS